MVRLHGVRLDKQSPTQSSRVRSAADSKSA
jgi:hypothetical protein